jgi:hypothetical protein
MMPATSSCPPAAAPQYLGGQPAAAEIIEFGKGLIGNPRPNQPTLVKATITGVATQLSSAHALAIASDGTIVVANTSESTEFVRGSLGNVPPVRSISAPTAGLVGLVAMTCDAAGNVYALYSADHLSPDASGLPAVAEFARGSSTPVRVISCNIRTLTAPRTSIRQHRSRSTRQAIFMYSMKTRRIPVCPEPSKNLRRGKTGM